MKYFIIIIYVLIISIEGNSQVLLNIKQVTVSNIKPPFSDKTIRSGTEDGPFLLFICELINKSDTKITIEPSKASYRISFKCHDENFFQDIFPLSFMRINKLSLEPNEKKEFVVDSHIFLGTNIYSPQKNDYSKDLIQSLPTVRIIYTEKEPNIKIISNQIVRVEINE